MSFDPRLLLVLGLVALVATPPAASAHQHPSPSTVLKHARSGETALISARALAGRGQATAAAVRLTRHRDELGTAASEARRLRVPRRRAAATRALARGYDRSAELLSGWVADAPTALQVGAAQLLTAHIRRRDAALDTLVALNRRLPRKSRRGNARVVVALSTDGVDEVRALVRALEPGRLPADVEPHVDRSLDTATTAVDRAGKRLEALLVRVPAAVRPLVRAAIGRWRGQVEQVVRLVATLIDRQLGPDTDAEQDDGAADDPNAGDDPNADDDPGADLPED